MPPIPSRARAGDPENHEVEPLRISTENSTAAAGPVLCKWRGWVPKTVERAQNRQPLDLSAPEGAPCTAQVRCMKSPGRTAPSGRPP
mmetsp:Transcript_94741/g.159117  ORF Transcript_94741/g.159117 Transcript_94741/m.159117 type:complete len:87 (-) Transcript_94741:527-787(-)